MPQTCQLDERLAWVGVFTIFVGTYWVIMHLLTSPRKVAEGVVRVDAATAG